MTSWIFAILLLQSSAGLPTLPARPALENPAVANPVPKALQKDYDKLWKRFVASPTTKDPTKEDAKLQTEFEKLLKKNPDLVSVILLQAYLELYAGRQAKAESRLEAILAKRPADRIALYYLAEFAYSRNEHVKASGLYRRLKAVDNSRPDLDLKSQRSFLLAMQSLVQEATSAAQAGRLNDAERFYRQAVELAPEETALHAQLAALLRPGGKADEAPVAPQRQNSADLQDLGRWGNQIERFREIRAAKAITREQLAGLLTRYFPQLAEFRQTPQIMTDVPTSWAAPAIETVVGAGILDATVNHTFEPARTVSRGEFAQVMARLARALAVSQPEPTLITAPDVVPGSALYRELQLVLGYGLLSLDNAGNFNVSAPVGGEEAVNTAEKMLGLVQKKPV
jgi:tetratricopeptide (TPR) repeat protein